MSDPILADMAAQLSRMDGEIKKAETYLSVLEEAGRNVTEQRARLRAAMVDREKFVATLRARGYNA